MGQFSLLSGKDVRFGDKQKQAKILQRCVILCQQPVTNAGSVQVGVEVWRCAGVLTTAPKPVNMLVTQHSNEVGKVGKVGDDV